MGILTADYVKEVDKNSEASERIMQMEAKDKQLTHTLTELRRQLAHITQRCAEEEAIAEVYRLEVRAHDDYVMPLLSGQACEISEMHARLAEMARLKADSELKSSAMVAQAESLVTRLQELPNRSSTAHTCSPRLT